MIHFVYLEIGTKLYGKRASPDTIYKTFIKKTKFFFIRLTERNRRSQLKIKVINSVEI